MTLMTLMTYDSDYDSDSDSLASENQPLYFTGKSYAKKGFANLKNLFSFICGFRIPDTGYRIPDSGFRIPDSGFLFRFPVPVSCSGFRFPGFGVALNGPEKPQEECPITSNVLMFQYVPIRAR